MDTFQTEVFQHANLGHNIILTGIPGTGKSFVLSHIIKTISISKNVTVTSSTGKSAVLLREALTSKDISCVTIHRFLGLLDGRYTNTELCNLFDHDERYESKRRYILDVNVLIIDEISLVSCKLFDQIECVLRHVKGNDQPFGGVQMIVSGDFYQLPPVPSPQYGDQGEYVLFSSSMKYFHHMNLDEIHRQKEEDFALAVKGLTRGYLERESLQLLKRLGRTLPPGEKPVHLYSTNLDVDIHNAQCLMDMEGEEFVYRCTDEGDVIGLKVKKEVHLKKSCPVMLLVNLSDVLVNGLTGTASKMEPECVHVYFPGLNRTEVITTHVFTKYCSILKKDIGSRRQLPLQLSYAMTVHKSQGMTLDRVSVDCRNMRQYGQLTVALSRAQCKKDLRIKNFTTRLLKKPPECINNFYQRQPLAIKDDLKCCINCALVMPTLMASPAVMPLETVQSYGDDGDDDDDDDDDDAIVKCLEGIESFSKDVTLLPDGIDVQSILEGLQIQSPKTDQQKQENDAVELLLTNIDRTRLFVAYLCHAIAELSDKHLTSTPNLNNKDIHSFYMEYNALICSESHRLRVTYLFGQNTSPAQDNIIYRVSTKLRNRSVHQKAEPIRDTMRKEAEHVKGTQFEESGEGRAKIRYIAGWCVSSLAKRCKRNIALSLYNKKKIEGTEMNILQKRLLENLQSHTEEDCEDTESLQEIYRKQNVRKGLFVVNDNAFNFFQNLDKKIRTLQSPAHFCLHHTNFGHFLKSSLINDANLATQWRLLFTEAEFDNIKARHNINLLLHEILEKYVLMSVSQFRKEYLNEKNVKKREATRKQIRMRTDKVSTTKFSFRTMKDDISKDKEASHKRLQSEILCDATFLERTFSKKELTYLCKAYSIQDKKALKTKKSMQESLNLTVVKVQKCPIPDSLNSFDEPFITDISSLNSVDIPAVDVSNDVQSVSGVPSVSDVQQSDERPCGSDVLDDSSFKCSKPKQKRNQQCIRKGKSTNKRRKVIWPCGICGKDASFDSIGCDGCDKWYHSNCLKLENLEELPEVWFCQECLNE